MALLLFIDTSTRNCSVLLTEDETIVAYEEVLDSLSHAKVLPGLIDNVMKKSGKEMKVLDGVIIAGGPGSYTGLRIGMSAAKGICYALDIPFIVLDTLECLADTMIKSAKGEDAYYIATLDSRKGEIYYAIADKSGKMLTASKPAVVDEIDWSYLNDKPIYIAGNTNIKIKNIKLEKDYKELELDYIAKNYFDLGYKRFINKDFDNLIYKEPNYLKPFQKT